MVLDRRWLRCILYACLELGSAFTATPKARCQETPSPSGVTESPATDETPSIASGGDTKAIDKAQLIVNGGFEEVASDGLPLGWSHPLPSQQFGCRVTVTEEGALVGARAALLTAPELRGNSQFGNLMQSFDATPFHGKRVRFRAAVRTADLGVAGGAQLWLRVDRSAPGSGSHVGAFDNMSNRPIRGSDWNHFEIVGDVDEDATRINIGLMILVQGKAWIDDASLEIVADDVPLTATSMSNSAATSGGTAGRSPDGPQPFWVSWLWLVGLTCAFLAFSATASATGTGQGLAQRFAFCFSVTYWLLYSLPEPLTSLLPGIGNYLSQAYGGAVDAIVRYVAVGFLGINRGLIAPNGSGDTTIDYVRLLVCFVVACAIALIWSSLDRRAAEHRELRDLLHSYLRYVLAISLLGYGLAKVGTLQNQFPQTGVDQLLKTYGESSPMNLVWTFMGSSRAYTFFAGAGEVLGGILLIWRRTYVLGAFVAAGVLLNIVMLNFCYDVPVKQYSAHLLAMAVYLIGTDARRLLNVFVLNRPTSERDLRPAFVHGRWIWGQRLIKGYVVIFAIAAPMIAMAWQEWTNSKEAKSIPAIFGSYEVKSFRLGTEEIPPYLDHAVRWRTVTLYRSPWAFDGSSTPQNVIIVRTMDKQVTFADVTLNEEKNTLAPHVVSGGSVLPIELTYQAPDEKHLVLTGTVGDKPLEVTLRRLLREDFLLVNRGFRWINEYPFNR